MNNSIFNKIDTEDKAYWLGFIYADGYISNAEKIHLKTKKWVYKIEVSLKEDDKKHLEKLSTFLEINKPIKVYKTNYPRKNRVRLFFNSKQIWNRLNEIGCTPNKSLTLTFPNVSIFKKTFLIKHFIRGYADGDGCIYISTSKANNAFRLTGTENILNTIQKHLPLEYTNKLWKKKNANVYDLAFNNKRGLYVLNFLYKDSTIYLNRKFDKYKEYCRLYE